ERPTADRQPSGPVRDGGQQKAGNGSCNVAIKHLMDVPIERAEMGRQDEDARVLRHPEENSERPPYPGNQKEWTESIGDRVPDLCSRGAVAGLQACTSAILQERSFKASSSFVLTRSMPGEFAPDQTQRKFPRLGARAARSPAREPRGSTAA